MTKLLQGTAAIALATGLFNPAFAQTGSTDDGAASDEIVVTARQRAESLTEVPVAVTAISSGELARNNATDLSRIAELSPNVIVGNYGGQGGGSLSIRGISSPANALGFEQSVSVSIDGVQSSVGYMAQLGFFDVEQVEILKGPQALLFGKNSPAGVISLRTALPTSRFYGSVQAAYEFVGDEARVDGVISGPLSDNLGARLAVRGRTMRGWLYNDARPIADNPFIAGPDGGIPGTDERRVGDEEFVGRLTLQFEPSNAVNLVLRGTYNHVRNQGAGRASQAIGECPTGFPNLFGQNDIYGECRPDNHLANANPPAAVAARFPLAPDDGRSFGELNIFATTLTGEFDLGGVKLTSITGYNDISNNTFFTHDQTSFGQVTLYEDMDYSAFSQEVRALTDFEGPFNLMVGGYYQDQKTSIRTPILLNDTFYNPAKDQYLTFFNDGFIKGKTLSAFFQGILDLDQFEIAGGVRWTNEKKRFQVSNVDGFPVTTFVPGRTLTNSFNDDNFSPEVTASWHPVEDTTIYLAYRTGYKSGSFNLTNPVQATSTAAGASFGPEKARGFDFGAKGEFLDGALFVDFNAFLYKYSDLQVNAFNPALFTYTTTNVGSVRQRGFELQARYKATPDFQLRGNIAYTRNRFRDFVGQCYSYRFPAGDTTSPAPAGCRFRTGTRILEQDFEGQAPARSPDWAGSFGATYGIDAPSIGRFELSSDAFYSSSYHASETKAPSTFQPSFWRLNAALTLTADDERWNIGLVGRNLTNKYYLLYAADATGGDSVPFTSGRQRAVVARGREVAIQFGLKF